MPDFGKIEGKEGDVPIQHKILHKNHLFGHFGSWGEN
jgi:hypothetical protein